MSRIDGVKRLVLGVTVALLSSTITPLFVATSVALGFIDIGWKILTGNQTTYAYRWSKATWNWYFNKWEYAFHGKDLKWRLSPYLSE